MTSAISAFTPAYGAESVPALDSGRGANRLRGFGIAAALSLGLWTAIGYGLWSAISALS